MSLSVQPLPRSAGWILKSCFLASASGSGTLMRLWKRRRTAGSSDHGRLVAARTSTPELFLPTPSICTRNSVFMRAVCSLLPPGLPSRLPQRASISLMKMMAGFFSRASSNSCRTSLVVGLGG
ncbi:hypothetical protein N657DRAFT_580881 [Parathielavia appendiculata]|uniref:Uncharacterized protein n=1 Tax=Parathielavia appendiculata TaxID=2587402 RepID=A0AAN6YZY8_9PEZI|nr:hypothetical protein N657DRAFT_580881 [Parathielavia appendiculata]